MEKRIFFIFQLLFTVNIIFSFSACSKYDDQVLNTTSEPYINTGNYNLSENGISEEVLKNYLSRAVTHTELLNSKGFYTDMEESEEEQLDNERMLLNIGAKFIGRALYQWSFEDYFNNPQWLTKAKEKADRIHKQDNDIILQAGIFECVTTKVNNIPIPNWVFEAFGKEIETRNFNYNLMLNKNGKYVNHFAPNQSIPDISQEETRMYYYFMARMYIDAGIEAIHFGTVELTSMNDKENYKYWDDLLKRVREMAKERARRGYVICDGHMPSGGIKIENRLIFDFVSFPLVPKELKEEPQKVVIEKFWGNPTFHAIYGRTLGGITPSGWECNRIPYIVEFDNMGISNHPGEAASSVYDGYVWGYDEITWFYLQEEEYRNSFLIYASDKITQIDPLGFLQFPCRRVVEPINGNRALYKANTKSANNPNGMSQEETIKDIWEKH